MTSSTELYFTLNTKADVAAHQRAVGLLKSEDDIEDFDDAGRKMFVNTGTGELFTPGDTLTVRMTRSKKLPSRN